MFKKLYSLLILSSVFLLTACHQSPIATMSTEVKKIVASVKESLSQTKKPNSNYILEIRENNSSIPDIYGLYTLIEGSYNYHNETIERKEKIQASTIVLEQLTPNEFGFYYVNKFKNGTSDSRFGAFLYKEGRFYKKIIDYPKTNTLLLDNITLIKQGNLIRLTVEGINRTRTMLWARSKKATPSLVFELNQEKDAYISLYKEKLY